MISKNLTDIAKPGPFFALARHPSPSLEEVPFSPLGSDLLPNPSSQQGTLVMSSACSVRIYLPRRRHLQFLRFPMFIPMKKDLREEYWPMFGSLLDTSTVRYGSIAQGRWRWWPSGINHTLVGIPSELVVRLYALAFITHNDRLLRHYRNPLNYFVEFDPQWYTFGLTERQRYLASIRRKQRAL